MLMLVLAGAAALQAAPATAPHGRGTVAVARATDAAVPPAFVEAVETALSDAGYVALPDTRHARSTATITVRRTAQGVATAPSGGGGIATPMGGTLGGNSVGAGVAMWLPGGQRRVGQLIETELTLRIARRGEAGPGWQGSAVTHQVLGTAADDPRTVAAKLAGAIVRNLDGPTGQKVSTP